MPNAVLFSCLVRRKRAVSVLQPVADDHHGGKPYKAEATRPARSSKKKGNDAGGQQKGPNPVRVLRAV